MNWNVAYKIILGDNIIFKGDGFYYEFYSDVKFAITVFITSFSSDFICFFAIA